MRTVQQPLGISLDDSLWRARRSNSASSSHLSPTPHSPALSSGGQSTPLDLIITPATPNSGVEAGDAHCASHYFRSPAAKSAWEPVSVEIHDAQKIHDEAQSEVQYQSEQILENIIVASPTSLDFSSMMPSLASIEQQLQAGPGRRRGLLIGIRYWGSEDPDNVLGGAYGDVQDMKQLLIDHFGWSHDDFTVLKDDRGDPGLQPTRTNLVREMKALVHGARPTDQLFLHFAGHGGQVQDMDGDEIDGQDEVLVTCDHHKIVDDELFDILVKPLPQGCRLTAVFDCCNSGTGLDLPEIVRGTSVPPRMRSYSPTPTPPTTKIRGQVRPRPPFRRLTEGRWDLPRVDTGVADHRPVHARKDSDGDVILWSACQDSEDAFEMKMQDGSIRGAMSHAFIQSVSRNAQQTYRDLLENLCAMLQQHRKHAQTPQLSGSRPIPMDSPICI
ncbi:hypothetical protein AURDEDRAFT_169349 [Auricularia subglabra TFB-10046 SS5]|nr:hypothetical protein AURDEDRAFT_169349 [Auricularia subglabra TFB-10046 SS5]